MFQFRRFPSYSYFIQSMMRGYCPRGFPHSEIHGSMAAFASPWLIADRCVLRRLLVPRHSPCALCSLTIAASDLSDTLLESSSSLDVNCILVTQFKIYSFRITIRYLALFSFQGTKHGAASGSSFSPCPHSHAVRNRFPSLLASCAVKFVTVWIFFATPRTKVRKKRKNSKCPNLVGSSGLEPPTSRLSGVRSHHLRYEPICDSRGSVPSFHPLVEMNGFEPMTPCLQSRCSPS